MRRRRRRSAALVGVLATALGGASIWSIGALTGNDMVEAAVTQAQNLADLIGKRSPGDRIEALLTKTKHARPLARARRAPSQHTAATKPSPNMAMTDIAQPLQAPPPVLAPPAPPPVEFPPFALNSPGPSIGSIVSPPSGTTPGGATPSSFPGPEAKQPVLVPSAVPEPQTWAMMLAGFGLIGWRMRARGQSKPLRV